MKVKRYPVIFLVQYLYNRRNVVDLCRKFVRPGEVCGSYCFKNAKIHCFRLKLVLNTMFAIISHWITHRNEVERKT